MNTARPTTGRLLRPGQFESELREIADELYAQAPAPSSSLGKLMSNSLSVEEAREFWSAHWHVDQAHNQHVLSRLMEGCPDVDARVQIFDVIGSEWGCGDPKRAYPELYRQFLLGLGVGAQDVPWEYDLERPDVVEHMRQWNNASWLELLVGELLAIKTLAPKVYGPVADALVAGPYGLQEEHVRFFREHQASDGVHCDIVFELVGRYAVTLELQEQARQALRSFAASSRYASLCCNVGDSTYAFAAQQGGIPLRLRDATPPALRNPKTAKRVRAKPA